MDQPLQFNVGDTVYVNKLGYTAKIISIQYSFIPEKELYFVRITHTGEIASFLVFEITKMLPSGAV